MKIDYCDWHYANNAPLVV